jgi:hypothetical protein
MDKTGAESMNNARIVKRIIPDNPVQCKAVPPDFREGKRQRKGGDNGAG